jgi:hypothetical protein
MILEESMLSQLQLAYNALLASSLQLHFFSQLYSQHFSQAE